MSTSTEPQDRLCKFCGRPIVGPAYYGRSGLYHPECTQGLETVATYKPIVAPDEIDHLGERIAALRSQYAKLEERVSALERVARTYMEEQA